MARSRKKIRKNITSMLQSHRNRRHLVLGVIPVALILVTLVTWSLHVNAITQSNDPICGQEEHTHTADCYAWVAVDENTETAGTITTSTSTSSGENTESETKSESASEDETASEVAAESETSTEETEETLQEGDTKIEDGVTYVYTLTCGKEEHTHTDECFEDESESESIWTNFGIALMSIEEGSEEESESESSSNTLTSTAATDFTTAADVTWDYDKVTYDDGTFTINFDVEFENLTKEEITAADYTFILYLPTGVEVPDSLLNTKVQGTVSGYSGYAFSYTIMQDSSGNYYMQVVFEEDYVDTLSSDATISGYMKFEATCGSSYVTTDTTNGEVVIGSGTAQIKIDIDDIETADDDENWLADISVTKSASSYDSTNKTITYTVVVSSEDGTNNKAITLTDLLSIVNNSEYSGTDVTISGITIDSVTYYSEYYGGNYGGTSSAVSYSSTVDGENLSITLPALSGAADGSYSWVTGDCYVITYTVSIMTESAEFNSSISNKATATSDTDGGTITDYATVTKTVAGHIASKSGSYNESGDMITWTITINASGANIAGYTLTDDAFAEIINGLSGLSITYSDGTTAGSGDYTINYVKDVNGADTDVIESITFNAISDTDGDGTLDSNTYTYTITYQTTTDASLGTSGYTETNEVVITNSEDKEVGESEGSVYVKAGGSMTKSQTDVDSTINYTYTDENKTTVKQATRSVKWTTTVYVPTGGIASGTVFYDYVGCWYGDTSNRNTNEADQWFTYDQIVELFGKLASNGITIGTNTITYDNGTNFTLEAYDPSTDEWVTYSDLTDKKANYTDTLFTAYRITFNADFDYTGTWTMTYSTTVDITDVLETDSVLSQTYYNTAKVGSLTAGSSYTEYEALYKTDGNGNRGTTDVSLDDDGNLTWIVKLYIAPGSSNTYTITDTLPAGLSFVSAKLEISSDSATLYASTAVSTNDGTMSTAYWWANTLNSSDANYGITGKITTTTNSNDTMIIELDSVDYSWLVSGGGYVSITYTAHIDNFDSTNLSNYTATSTDSDGNPVYTISDGYTNNVTVEWGANKLTDDQTQKVTYTKVSSSTPEETTHDTVIKDGDYKKETGLLTYQVALNIDGDTLNDGNDMTFTDIATTYSNSSYGTVISLKNGSVTFYKLYKLSTDTDGYYYYTDADGNQTYVTDSTSSKVTSIDTTDSTLSTVIYVVNDGDANTPVYTYYYKEEISLAWTYDENDTGYGTVYHTITSTVIPDSTPILVEYQYSVITISGEGEYLSVSNTASLTGDSTTEGSDYDQESGQWQEPTASAGLTADGGLTIIKVNENNYDTTIADTKFALYKYDTNTSSWVQVTKDDYGYYYEDGDLTTPKVQITDSADNPMDENNYLTTDSNGALTITKNYTDSSGNVLGTYSWYEPWTLYYIVEVEAAAGYTIISSNTIYFYWSEYESTSGTATGSLTYPTGMYSWNTTTIDLNVSPSQKYVTNGEITTFTLVKTDKSDKTTVLSGATFALYRYAGVDSSGNEIWKRIGTYITDKNGEISITYDDSLYTYNQAYKLTEISSADGYNIAWGDETEFYFWWVSDDVTTYPQNIPGYWGDGDDSVTAGTTYAAAVDISSESKTVTATNTKTTSTIAVTKVWIDENGDAVTNDNYTSEVRLYYYVGDEDGNPVSTTDSSNGQIVMLTTTSDTASDTTQVELYSYSTQTDLSSLNSTYLIYDASQLVSNICYYTDGYIEVVVEGGDNPSSMTLMLNMTDNTNISILPSAITSELKGTTSYYTVKYYIEDILTAISASGYSKSDINYYNVQLDASSLSTTGKFQSLKVIAPTTTATSELTSINYTFNSSTSDIWSGFFWGDSSYLSQDGAVLAVNYSGNNTPGSTVQVGLHFNDGTTDGKTLSGTVMLSAESGTAYINIAGIIGSDSVDWSTFEYAFFNYVTWSGDQNTADGTKIESVSVLLPATTTTTSTQYVIKKSDNISYELTDSWHTYFYGDSAAAKYLASSGAIVYIDYTCTEIPDVSNTEEYAEVGIRYNTTDQDVDKYTITSLIAEGTNNILAIPASAIISGTYDLSDFEFLYLSQKGGAITINSVSILIPYSTAEAVSGTLIETDYTVALYKPSFSSTISISGGWAWNAISSRATEPDIDGSTINSTYSTDTAFTGYAFLDAIYSNLDSTVEIVLKDVSSGSSDTDAITSLLKDMQLIIQGDLSANYGQIATVTPTKVTYNDDGTYTLTYSSSAIVNSLASSSATYSSASEAYADYNALILSLNSETALSATLESLTVVSEEINTMDTYTEENLLGTIYGGVPYTDSSGNTCIYELNSSNNWTVALYNLPLTYTSGGVTYYYYYYFVETEYTGGSTAYTVTYSQTEGENDGGEIVITNITTTYELPGSGGIGTGIFYICGILILGFGVVLIILKMQPGTCIHCFSRSRKTIVRNVKNGRLNKNVQCAKCCLFSALELLLDKVP